MPASDTAGGAEREVEACVCGDGVRGLQLLTDTAEASGGAPDMCDRGGGLRGDIGTLEDVQENRFRFSA